MVVVAAAAVVVAEVCACPFYSTKKIDIYSLAVEYFLLWRGLFDPEYLA